jgi:hypothetical protein
MQTQEMTINFKDLVDLTVTLKQIVLQWLGTQVLVPIQVYFITLVV